jgi:HEPN domain-containing protein
MELDIVAEWYRFAERDLSSADFLQGHCPQPLEIICYLCQQSAEKYLKGYLIHQGTVEPPKTHDLDVLYMMCKSFDERFHVIKRACNTLTMYSVHPRYPNEMEITKNDMHMALEHARLIQGFELIKILEKKSFSSS